MQHEAAKAGQFQVSECNFEVAYADSTPAQCITSQRKQLQRHRNVTQVSKGSSTPVKMQHKLAKAAQR
jgi:hypothetical protein